MTQESFLLREPLLARDSRFCGYHFHPTRPEIGTPYRQLFAAHAAGRPTGGLCVIEDAGEVLDEVTDAIPQGLTTLVRPNRADRIAGLRQRRIATCAQIEDVGSDLPPTLTAAEYVWLSVGPSGNVKTLAKFAQRLPGKRIVAGLSTRDQFEDAKEVGAQMVQGDWYTRPAGPPPKAVAPGQATILELIKQTQAEAPAAKLEELIKRDAALSFRLLRYINSAGFGLSCEIQSFRHAVSILGYQNLGRWLALLLATSGTSAAAPVLMREAATRGRLTELMGESLVAPDERDNLFIVGVFSLLPAILQFPMEKLVEQLSLPEAVNDALLSRTGLYGPILKLAESVEGRDGAAVEKAAQNMQLGSAQVNRFHLEALAWANQLAA